MKKIIKGRLPLLRSLNLATDRVPVHMEATDGSIIEISEWVSGQAIDAAHSNPEVLALWEEFAATCTYEKLATLSEAEDLFASFKAVEL